MNEHPLTSTGVAPDASDYGIDAPGIRAAMLIAGAAGLAIAAVAGLALTRFNWVPPSFAVAGIAVGLIAATYGFFMGGYMTYASRVGKLRTREMLLDAAAAMRTWTGHEAVLDVGCGRGLMLIGAARRLLTGTAVGIDLWRAEDQDNNSVDATLANARREGVANKVRVDTGDARKLPYGDDSFDLVLSHWVVHNIDAAADRFQVLDEMLRVLRPGGVIALADIAFLVDYQQHLLQRGAVDLQFLNGGVEARIMGLLSAGSFRPQALLVRKV